MFKICHLILQTLNYRIFTRAWNIKLDAKRATEAEAERSAKSKAADDLANWTAQRDIRLSAKKDQNRSEEQVLLETLESEVEAANTWDRVTKLIDASAEVGESDKADVARMRKLFIQLKNEPLEKTRGAQM